MIKIKESAILSNGKVYTGKRHCHCLDKISILWKRPADEVQGFVTNEGKFVDRIEWAKIALESWQITHLKYSNTELYSEDLY